MLDLTSHVFSSVAGCSHHVMSTPSSGPQVHGSAGLIDAAIIQVSAGGKAGVHTKPHAFTIGVHFTAVTHTKLHLQVSLLQKKRRKKSHIF